MNLLNKTALNKPNAAVQIPAYRMIQSTGLQDALSCRYLSELFICFEFCGSSQSFSQLSNWPKL